MFLRYFILLVCALPVIAQQQSRGAGNYNGLQDMHLAQWRAAEATIATLPAASASTGQIFLVMDSFTPGSCSAGSGSNLTFCRSNGSAYVCIANCATGGGGGGGSPAGPDGTFQRALSGSFAAGNLLQHADGSVNASTALTQPSPCSPAYNVGGTTTCDLACSTSCAFTMNGGDSDLGLIHPHGSGPYFFAIKQDAPGNRHLNYPASMRHPTKPDLLGGSETTFLCFYDGSALYRCFGGESSDLPFKLEGSERAVHSAPPESGTGRMIFDSFTHQPVFTQNNSATQFYPVPMAGMFAGSSPSNPSIAPGFVLPSMTSPPLKAKVLCILGSGLNNSGSVLTNADLGPQEFPCEIPADATITEIWVRADAGTSNVIIARERTGAVANLVSSALGTTAGGYAGMVCASVAGGIGSNGATTCFATLQNAALLKGDWVGMVSGTADGFARRFIVVLLGNVI